MEILEDRNGLRSTLDTSQLPVNKFGLMYMGTFLGAPVPFKDGLRCVGGNTRRRFLQNSGATGTFVYGPGLSAFSVANFPPAYHLLPGTIWHFQSWYRDPGGPCGQTSNLSNSATVSFVP